MELEKGKNKVSEMIILITFPGVFTMISVNEPKGLWWSLMFHSIDHILRILYLLLTILLKK